MAGGCNALGHPTRLNLLYAIRSRGESSPVQLADLLAPDTRPVSAVAYHVRRLLEAGLIELAGTRPVRGALEHRYRVTGLGAAWLAALDSLHRR
jgi:DNA-binding transcriptional ArsR family regulator